jgi:NAD(P)-dependent dehydrogenase (short-subunit alcohol dehydrogenase family)
MDVNGRRIVVMGGGSGIGEATAALFAARGGEVVITGRSAEKLERAAARMEGKVTTRAVDATSVEQLAAFFTEAGQIDHLVLAVSSAIGAGEFAALDLTQLRQGFEAKFWAHLQTLQAALPVLARDGSVVFVTAASAQAALPGTAGLAAINGALEKTVPPLAAELAPLRINAVSPGVVDTPWWDFLPEGQRAATLEGFTKNLPLARVGQAEEIAQAIYLLATNPNITGTVLEIAGGGHLATGR